MTNPPHPTEVRCPICLDIFDWDDTDLFAEKDGAYVPLPVKPEQFTAALRALPMLGFAGANVTVPHKEAALKAVDRSDSAARRIGAVNTIVVAPDGTLDGSNSDGFGFMENLHAGAPAWSPQAGPAVILGAGGAARAVAVAHGICAVGHAVAVIVENVHQ